VRRVVPGNSETEFRSVYISSQRGECCQIWIDAPADGFVAVHAADADTINDEEIQNHWRVPVSDAADALEVALEFVRQWLSRAQP